MKVNIKKLILPNLPYALIGLLATKVGQAWRMAEGADFSGKVIHLMGGFAAAFQSILPSFHPIDLCVGVAVAVALRLAVYIKGKNVYIIIAYQRHNVCIQDVNYSSKSGNNSNLSKAVFLICFSL